MKFPLFPFTQDILQFGAAGFFLACFILAFFLIRGQPKTERHKMIYTFFFLTFVVGVILLLVPLIPPPAPKPTSEWAYFATESGADAASKLTVAGPDPKNVAATLFKGHEFRVWYRGGGSGTKFAYRDDLTFDPTKPAAYEVFYNNGNAVPIGFGGKYDNVLLYFNASK